MIMKYSTNINGLWSKYPFVTLMMVFQISLAGLEVYYLHALR